MAWLWVDYWTQSTCGDGVAAVVKELPQSRAAVGPPGLLPINGVKRLVDEQAQGAHDEGPRRSLGVWRWERADLDKERITALSYM